MNPLLHSACLVVAGLINCIVSPTPALNPADAAALLAPHQFVYIAPLPAGPESFGIYSSPTAGPFGELYLTPNTRRLDGTSLDAPPLDYGYGYVGRGYYGGRSYYGGHGSNGSGHGGRRR